MGPVTGARGKRGAWAGSLVALVLLLVLGAAAPALAAPRDLDLSFGDEGVATTRCIDDSGEWLHDCSTLDVAIQPDGKIITGGVSSLSRLNSNGSLDASFGSGGIVGDLASDAAAFALALQPDGKIVTVGYVRESLPSGGSNHDVQLKRYNADGSLDTSFDGDGMLTTDIGSKGNSLSDMALRPNGKIVVAGQAADPNGSRGYETNLALARYNPNGTLDTDFGGDGTFTNSLSPSTDFATSLALRPDSKIVTAGQANNERGVADRLVTRHCGDGCRPTGPVTGFSATGYGDHIDLTWTNPTDADYATTRIYRSDSGFAARGFVWCYACPGGKGEGACDGP